MQGGELIHQASDEFGAIQVIDYQQQLRCLHFNNSTQQSAMLLRHPSVLIHRYTQAMVLPLCWNTASRVLVLGLGAGAITRYLYHYFPELNIDAVEIRRAVIDIAREYFLLPDNDARLMVVNEDALLWLPQQTTEQSYDIVFVDMFLTSRQGIDELVDVGRQLNDIASMLGEHGVIVFNHLGTEALSYPLFTQLLQNTMGFYLYEVGIDEANTVIYACKQPCPASLTDEYFYPLEKRHSSPFKQYHDRLKRVDTSF